MGILANFYSYFIAFMTFWVLVHGIGGIAGWDFSDLSFLYGLSLLSYSIAGTLLWYTVYHMDKMINTGELDLFLIRPYGILEQMIFQRFGDTFLGQILVTIIFLLYAIANKIDYFNLWKCKTCIRSNYFIICLYKSNECGGFPIS